MGRTVYHPDAALYEDYYLHQTGRGLPVFSGPALQRGHGLGGILGGVMRMAVPLLKKGAKYLGRQALQTGVGLAEDVLAGKNIKSSAKQRLTQMGTDTLHHIGRQVKRKPPPRKRSQSKPIKRKSSHSHVTLSKAAKVARPTPDIFD